ncbi:hypothetical protein MMC28_008708 [Mycoblastus sanguinarius]|nr:hypothetical protein [Mycoblastus sanguinarius]
MATSPPHTLPIELEKIRQKLRSWENINFGQEPYQVLRPQILQRGRALSTSPPLKSKLFSSALEFTFLEKEEEAGDLRRRHRYVYLNDRSLDMQYDRGCWRRSVPGIQRQMSRGFSPVGSEVVFPTGEPSWPWFETEDMPSSVIPGGSAASQASRSPVSQVGHSSHLDSTNVEQPTQHGRSAGRCGEQVNIGGAFSRAELRLPVWPTLGKTEVSGQSVEVAIQNLHDVQSQMTDFPNLSFLSRVDAHQQGRQTQSANTQTSSHGQGCSGMVQSLVGGKGQGSNPGFVLVDLEQILPQTGEVPGATSEAFPASSYPFWVPATFLSFLRHQTPTLSSMPKSRTRIRPCYILIVLGFLTIVGSLAPALWRSADRDDLSGGFSLGQYILGVGVFVIGCAVAIHSKTCTCWC